MSGLFTGRGRSSGQTAPTANPTPSTAGAVDARLLAFVEEAEGFSPKAFSDYHQYSIGYGTRAKGPDETITKAEAAVRLAEELATHAVRIDKAVAQSGLTLNANQRDALISFDFNTGVGAHLITTSHSVAEIAARLPTWNKVTEGGKLVVNAGLVNRRAAEMQLFNSGQD